MAQRGGRANARRRGRPSAAVQIRRLRNDMQGHHVTPSLDPHSFVQLPWNNWTFERTYEANANPATQDITVIDIIDQLVARVGLTSATNCRIKIASCRAWVTAKGLVYPDLAAEFYEIAGQQSETINRFPRYIGRDKGTLNRPARVGYNFPTVDRKEILGSDQGTLLLAKITDNSGVGSTITIRFQILWQSGPTPFWQEKTTPASETLEGFQVA
jgi:hypothetical protein